MEKPPIAVLTEQMKAAHDREIQYRKFEKEQLDAALEAAFSTWTLSVLRSATGGDPPDGVVALCRQLVSGTTDHEREKSAKQLAAVAWSTAQWRRIGSAKPTLPADLRGAKQIDRTVKTLQAAADLVERLVSVPIKMVPISKEVYFEDPRNPDDPAADVWNGEWRPVPVATDKQEQQLDSTKLSDQLLCNLPLTCQDVPETVQQFFLLPAGLRAFADVLQRIRHVKKTNVYRSALFALLEHTLKRTTGIFNQQTAFKLLEECATAQGLRISSKSVEKAFERKNKLFSKGNPD